MRIIAGGINWIWYHTDTEEEAKKWFKELTGAEPYESTIVKPVKREIPGDYDHMYGFRIHR